MNSFSRADTSALSRWWWTVDRWALVALIVLIAVGAVLTMAASPGASARIGLDPYHFVRRQFFFLVPAVILLFSTSLLSVQSVRRLAVMGFILSAALVVLTLLIGPEMKGAHRWLHMGGFTFQPSEFLKPFFAVTIAWMLAMQRTNQGFPGRIIAGVLFLLSVGLLTLQPDVGMAMTVTGIWFVELFLAGLPLIWVAGSVVLGIGALTSAYVIFPHVASRIDRFLDPASGDSYQVDTSLRAFEAGGFFGRGPGEGTVKDLLPDAHTDFIFAVAGEELGLLACLAIVGIFAFIVLRGLVRVMRTTDLFVLLSVAGLLTQFGTQALVNMGVTVRLLPAKGMTLPFVSYGGSSLLATALAMGMVLALTRERPGWKELAA